MAPIDIIATGFLDRLTVFRSHETRLSLWPRTSPTGLTEYDTKCLVYTKIRWDGSPPLNQIGPIGGDSLRQRYSRAPVQVFYSDGFDECSWAYEPHDEAVAILNEALGGELTYVPPVFGEIPPATMEQHVVLTIDREHEACAGMIAATAERPAAGPAAGILRVNYCRCANACNVRVPLHEIAHTFGLRHTEDPNDVMCMGSGVTTFSPKERLVIRLMLQRRPGNIFPDTDVCRWNAAWCLD
jgi:hypothetical protein